jgi:uncharacterized repeat protein (TIGR02543 family)
MPAQDLTLQAQWQVNQYQLRFDTAGGQPLANRAVNYGAALSLPTPERAGYAFKGWSTAAPATMPAQDLLLTATWQPDSATVTTKGGSMSILVSIGLGVLVLLRRSSQILLLSVPFFAQASQVYFGIHAGKAANESDSQLESDVNRKLQNLGITGTAQVVSNSDNSFRVFMGYPINSWLAAEVGWMDLGQAKLSYDNFTPQAENRLMEVQPQRGRGVEVGLVATYQVGSALFPFARVGLFHSQNQFQLDGPEQQQEFKQRSLRPGIELGAYYRIQASFDLGLSVNQYNTENFSTRQWQFGFRYHF